MCSQPGIADQVIREQQGRLWSLGRILITEPELINKYAENRLVHRRRELPCSCSREGCTGHTDRKKAARPSPAINHAQG